MNIIKTLFLVLIHVSAGFRSLDDLEKFYKLRPSYDPYGTVSSMLKSSRVCLPDGRRLYTPSYEILTK